MPSKVLFLPLSEVQSEFGIGNRIFSTNRLFPLDITTQDVRVESFGDGMAISSPYQSVFSA